MTDILKTPAVEGFIRMCEDGWLQGWHERNGGNLTYRMTEEDVEAARPAFTAEPREWHEMGVACENLAGEYFITTGFGQVLPQRPPGARGQHRHRGDQRCRQCLADRVGP